VLLSLLRAGGAMQVGLYSELARQHIVAARFPEPAAIGDLDRWHVFETEAPDTFAGMYQFWVRKLRVDRAPNSR
jgi:hypothetical protein